MTDNGLFATRVSWLCFPRFFMAHTATGTSSSSWVLHRYAEAGLLPPARRHSDRHGDRYGYPVGEVPEVRLLAAAGTAYHFPHDAASADGGDLHDRIGVWQQVPGRVQRRDPLPDTTDIAR